MISREVVIEGSFEVKFKLQTIWTDGKAEVETVREAKRKRKIREEKESEERRCMRTKM